MGKNVQIFWAGPEKTSGTSGTKNQYNLEYLRKTSGINSTSSTGFGGVNATLVSTNELGPIDHFHTEFTCDFD